MRLHIKIKTEKSTIPFDHQALLTGCIHKWLGWNNEHGEISLYSFSRLEGAKAVKAGLKFENDSSFFFSSHSDELIKRMITGIQSSPTMFNHLQVSEIIIQQNPDLSDRTLFYVASPVFIKRQFKGNVEHILYTDSRANSFLKETMETKMQIAGIKDETFNIRFESSYAKAGTKKVTYNGIENRASWCPAIIEGNAETKLFAWNVGLGNSTGIGFGAIK
ncbi:MAG: CRISPR-associated endoribonuclease Cas6 [Lentimicrobiaceae bacterium]|nr:CRISPR-associated endoribonuclease Cas6 [Lentimicrobiaceae bacterium]MCO5266669.1 CRISPR-associated endoribonuclease Cas6 [Lentimicrobium sp.]